MNIDENSTKIKIISEPTAQNPFVVIYKPRNISSAPLTKDDKDCALFQVAKQYPEVLEVKGKKQIEGGLLHRIDNATAGLLLIATNQDSYDKLLLCQENNNFVKTYTAHCKFIEDYYKLKEGFSENSIYKKIESLKDGESLSFELKSLFRPFGVGRREVRPVLENASKVLLKKTSGKVYLTKVEVTKNGDDYSVICKITNGFRHQVRCHLAWCKIPVIGDALYNPVREGEFNFTASQIEFIHPISGEKVSFLIV